jgi:hypothetical protein
MLLENVRSRQTPSQQLHGRSLFEYFQAHPREGRLFDAAMNENAAPGAEDIVAIDGRQSWRLIESSEDGYTPCSMPKSRERP